MQDITSESDSCTPAAASAGVCVLRLIVKDLDSAIHMLRRNINTLVAEQIKQNLLPYFPQISRDNLIVILRLTVCGCCAVTLSAYILKQLEEQNWKKVLFLPTGALLSKTSFNEGKSVPGISHALVLESPR